VPDIRQEVIDLLRQPQLGSLATITLDGKPWTRYVMIHSDADFNVRSAIGVSSRKVKQIEANPEVHLTFGITDPRDLNRPYVQLQGLGRVTTDPAEREACWFDMLSAVFKGRDDPNYAVLVVEPYRAELIRPGTMTPEVWEK
jgi:general stress protein 26